MRRSIVTRPKVKRAELEKCDSRRFAIACKPKACVPPQAGFARLGLFAVGFLMCPHPANPFVFLYESIITTLPAEAKKRPRSSARTLRTSPPPSRQPPTKTRLYQLKPRRTPGKSSSSHPRGACSRCTDNTDRAPSPDGRSGQASRTGSLEHPAYGTSA